MKNKLLIIFAIFLISISYANESQELKMQNENTIQTRINNIGYDLLNKNKITKRIVFVYDETEKKQNIEAYDSLTKRQVVVYGDKYKNIESDNELAAYLAREISYILKSYSGMWGGRIDTIQVAMSSKKFEIVADKRAVDFMVKAGYNPIALIVYINKTFPQKRTDKISRHNLTSKRLAILYEYISYKYPNFLENNEYENNKYYQNFLLTSINNRAKLQQKIHSYSTGAVRYE